MTDLALGINQEQSTEGLRIVHVRSIFIVHAICLHGFTRDVGEEREGDKSSESSLFARRPQPAQVGERRVARNPENDSVDGSELFLSVVVGEEFGGTDKGPVRGEEEEDDPLPFELVERDVGDGVVSLSAVEGEGGSGLTDGDGHWYYLFV